MDDIQSKMQSPASAPAPMQQQQVPNQRPHPMMAQANLASMHLQQMYRPQYMPFAPPQMHSPAAFMAQQPARQQVQPDRSSRPLQMDANGSLYHIDPKNQNTRL